MSIVTFPTACALQLAALSLGQQRFDITEQSDGNGNTATRLGAPPRWRANLRSVPAMVAADAARWKALQLGLRGRINHLALWDITNPQPRGTARGVITLAATAAAGATSLQLAGCLPAPNLLSGGGFEIDTDSDGMSDQWVRYQDNVTGAAWTRVAGNNSAWAQRCYAGSLGPTNASRVGVSREVAVGPGVLYAFAADVIANFSTLVVRLRVDFYTAANSFLETASLGIVGPLTWERLALVATAPATAGRALVYIWAEGAGTTLTAAQIYIDNVQLQAAASASPYAGQPTLLQGDMLQIGAGVGSHYCMVTADATATDAGAITVSIEPPLRQAISGGTAVAWDKPLCHFKQTADAAGWDAVPGSSDVGSFALDLIEDWRA